MSYSYHDAPAVGLDEWVVIVDRQFEQSGAESKFERGFGIYLDKMGVVGVVLERGEGFRSGGVRSGPLSYVFTRINPDGPHVSFHSQHDLIANISYFLFSTIFQVSYSYKLFKNNYNN